MRISTAKSEAMTENESLAQVKEFLRSLFTSEGTMEREIVRIIGAAWAVLRSRYRTTVTKRELSQKAKLSIHQSIFVPTLNYGHEGWGDDRKDEIAGTSGQNGFSQEGSWLLP